ncbi:MAG: hypothetical protein AVDCRST_MAG24-549 [uncultured Nocardioidaceae bacterium]|uniref:Uncharacterized protein n=1 Tax=uncultured Nocardioidaceae bacterium TaxID=253824 RepID=A0A6J4L806_9ACTN|nr:MAG: hypothetical protein AVDCRST_MAG24-549 [uncultured Nocardioidaceae bacterium]
MPNVADDWRPVAVTAASPASAGAWAGAPAGTSPDRAQRRGVVPCSAWHRPVRPETGARLAAPPVRIERVREASVRATATSRVCLAGS